MRWTLLILLLSGCAVAIGDNSKAAADINTDFKREVTTDTPTIEETLSPNSTRKPK